MNITIGAKCWDGIRRESLPIKVEAMRKTEKHPVKRHIHPGVKSALGFLVPVALLASGMPRLTFAAPGAVTAMALPDVSKQMILHAFDPLINLIQALAYPIAGVMIAGGCLFVMVGNRDRGMQMLQNASIGYILCQLAPLFLKILVGVGGSM